eukprot:142684-Lingulodinium_polyedra.AAC.1
MADPSLAEANPGKASGSLERNRLRRHPRALMAMMVPAINNDDQAQMNQTMRAPPSSSCGGL